MFSIVMIRNTAHVAEGGVAAAPPHDVKVSYKVSKGRPTRLTAAPA